MRTRSGATARRGLPRPYLALAAALAVLGTLGVAGASSLGVTSRGASVVTGASPCTGTAVVAPALPRNAVQYSGVRVTLPSGCTGRQVSVTVVAKGQFTGSALVASPTVIDFGATYNVNQFEAVTATVDGWNLAVTWTP